MIMLDDVVYIIIMGVVLDDGVDVVILIVVQLIDRFGKGLELSYYRREVRSIIRFQLPTLQNQIRRIKSG